ncbi:MAG: hypothetical protein GY729_17885, partial [Desulfobacteraceae bacterium]|nr:hypothetical protein [Desulfobacteraceae bacterium]
MVGTLGVTETIDQTQAFQIFKATDLTLKPEDIFRFFEDFIGHVTLPASTGAAGGWKATGDATYDIVAAAGSIGGQLQLT